MSTVVSNRLRNPPIWDLGNLGSLGNCFELWRIGYNSELLALCRCILNESECELALNLRLPRKVKFNLGQSCGILFLYFLSILNSSYLSCLQQKLLLEPPYQGGAEK